MKAILIRAFGGPDYVSSPSVDVPVPAAVRGMTGRDGVEAIAKSGTHYRDRALGTFETYIRERFAEEVK